MLKYALRYAPLLILALLLILFRLTGWGQQSQPIANPTLQTPRPGSVLYGVAMLSSQDAWAVGGTFTRQNPTLSTQKIGIVIPSNGLILRYTTNNGWQPDNVEHNLTEPLLSVSLDSTRDGWAVGYNATFVHYNGDAWSTVPGPIDFNKNVMSVTALSPSDAWAVGYGGSILHYDGKQWTLIQSPTSFDLRSIVMSSAQEGWVVGDNGTILHFSNGSWRAVESPTHNSLHDVVMLSSQEGWVVGNNGTILHYRAGVWESVDSTFNTSQPVNLVGVSMSSVHSGWIIGDQHVLTYHDEIWIEPKSTTYLNNGKYTTSSPNYHELYSIALSPSGQGWAVGRMDGGNNTTLIILHYQNNTWSLYPITGQ